MDVLFTWTNGLQEKLVCPYSDLIHEQDIGHANEPECALFNVNWTAHRQVCMPSNRIWGRVTHVQLALRPCATDLTCARIIRLQEEEALRQEMDECS